MAAATTKALGSAAASVLGFHSGEVTGASYMRVHWRRKVIRSLKRMHLGGFSC